MERRIFIKNSALTLMSVGLVDPVKAQYLLSDSGQNGLPDVEVRMLNGRPTVYINGKPNALPGYSPGTDQAFYNKYMPLFYKHKMGVYLVWIDGWGASAENRWWVGDTVSENPLFVHPSTVLTLENQVEQIDERK